jgi:lipid-A-disaccharide synthase
MPNTEPNADRPPPSSHYSHTSHNSHSSHLSYPRIFIAAGEHSGDRFGASLAEALRRLRPDVRLTGVGGPRMAAAGVRVIADTVGHSGMGLLSTFGNAQRWVRVFRNCIREFNREPPDILVPIDNPGFNLRLAGHARARKIPVCYYVSPQVWAWMPHRIHRIARLVTRMMTILPFEKALYNPLGVDCRYVGHPVLDYMAPAVMDEPARARFLETLGASGRIVVGLLPGSRSQEIRHTFPIICDAAAMVRRRIPDILFVVAATTEEHLPELQSILAAKLGDTILRVNQTPQIMQTSKLCLVVSGTATLETAYFRTPMVVVYRTNKWARHLAPRLLKVPHICLVNILAAHEAVPEFLKFDNNPRPIADAAYNLLADPAAWDRCRNDLAEVIRSLGPAGTSERAATAVLDCMESRC